MSAAGPPPVGAVDVEGTAPATAPAGPDPVRRAAMAVGVATAASGVGLMVAPRVALWAMGAGRSDPAPFLFRVVGMFMAVSGGSMVDVCRSPEPSRVGVRWAMITKLGAAGMVSAGVLSGRFGRRAWALAAVDAVSAGLAAALGRRR